MLNTSTDLNAPKLNWHVVDESTIMVLWTNDGCTPNDVEYVLSVINSTNSDPVKYVTNLMNTTLSIMKDTEYIITVTAQLCGGHVTSNGSEPLHLYFPGFTTPMTY